jgi:hypothetical protein
MIFYENSYSRFRDYYFVFWGLYFWGGNVYIYLSRIKLSGLFNLRLNCWVMRFSRRSVSCSCDVLCCSLVYNYDNFRATEGSSWSSKQLATGLYPKPDSSTRRHHTLFLYEQFKCYRRGYAVDQLIRTFGLLSSWFLYPSYNLRLYNETFWFPSNLN